MEHNHQQLVLFPNLIIATEPEAHEVEIKTEPYEVVTQQQLSRVVSLILMMTFGVFLVGYSIGKYTSTKSYDTLIPTELFGVFFGAKAVPVQEIQGKEIAGVEYARVATLEEAVTLSSRLEQSEIVTRTSRSVSGEEKTWYQVLLKKGSQDDR